MTNWNWLAAGLVLAASACTPVAPASGPEATVVRITDGDTVVVAWPGGAEEKIRVIGADSPETVKPGTPVQCGGREATAFASVTLLGQAVRIVADPTQGMRDPDGRYLDRYGRTLAYVELVQRNETTGAAANSDYSTLLVEAGLAHADVYNRAHPPQRIAQIQAAEHRASEARRGIFGALCPAVQ